MELHMREQTRQVDQERWRLTQEESRMKALQAAVEDERRITMEQLSSQRAEVNDWNQIAFWRKQKNVTREDRHFLKGVGQFLNNKFLDSKTAENNRARVAMEKIT